MAVSVTSSAQDATATRKCCLLQMASPVAPFAGFTTVGRAGVLLRGGSRRRRGHVRHLVVTVLRGGLMSGRRSVLSVVCWRRVALPAAAVTAAGFLVATPAGATSTSSSGNANVQLSSSVSSLTTKPMLGLALSASRTDAIPGDTVNYTA
jgi:hypothetical protein